MTVSVRSLPLFSGRTSLRRNSPCYNSDGLWSALSPSWKTFEELPWITSSILIRARQWFNLPSALLRRAAAAKVCTFSGAILMDFNSRIFRLLYSGDGIANIICPCYLFTLICDAIHLYIHGAMLFNEHC